MDERLRARARRLNKAPVIERGRDYVLCWLQQSLRAEHNPILDFAIEAANSLGLPVLVYHGVDNRYQYASHRLHAFILEASRSLGPALAERGVAFCRYVRRPGRIERGLVYRLCERAACLVTDDEAAYVARAQAERVARRAPLAVFAVDAAMSVPRSLFFEEPCATTSAFRRAHQALRDEHLSEWRAPEPSAPPLAESFPFHDELGDGDALCELIASCGVDMSVGPAPRFVGSREAALGALEGGIESGLERYKSDRNNPAVPTSGSALSPYLHFGVLDAREVARRVREAAHVGDYDKRKYLDELLTWREYFHHLASLQAAPSSWVNLPSRALETLITHEEDPREAIYSLTDLVHGRTGDETWDAAQKQYLLEGWMHNNIRMYWGNKIIGWRRTPADAWRTACYLNDRLSLDGRDPATYGNMRWVFGASKPGWSETPVYGWVRRSGDKALRKRRGAAAWLAEQAARPVEREASIPRSLTELTEAMGYLDEPDDLTRNLSPAPAEDVPRDAPAAP